MRRVDLTWLAAWALVVVAGACGNGRPSQRTPPAPTRPVAATAANADRFPGDFEVARVDGRPVYASCVHAQSAEHPALPPQERRAVALRECIDFELLAAEAARRGLAGDPEVAQAARTAAVNRFIELEVDDKIRTPDDLPRPLWERVMARNRWRLSRVEYRASHFIRFVVAKGEPVGGPADLAARAAAERLAAAARDERGLFTEHFRELAQRHSDGARFEEGSAELSDPARLVPSYSDALFAIPELGRTSPAVRTEWGWDVILWTKVLPARTLSEAELAAELFPQLRQAYFVSWSKAVGKSIGVQVYPEVLELGAPSKASP